MGRTTWGIVAAVIALTAVGTMAALLVSGSGDDGGPDYHGLPKCENLALVLPGQPTLKQYERLTSQPLEHGLDPAFMDLTCETSDLKFYASIEVFQAGDLDLDTAKQYADKAVHDSRSRAKEAFTLYSQGLDELGADLRYSSHASGASECRAYRLKKNALVMVERPVTGDAATSPDRFNAACRQIAESQTSKLMGTLLE
ncbi:MAG: hypothetical protein JF587_06730 [Catenulisporales bacterium]|nr:hypothetical protein [Catenulisporales bacterium]